MVGWLVGWLAGWLAGFARSVQTLNSELPDSMICIMYGGFGSRGVQISDSELPESIIRIMFGGCGLGDVQNSNSEHLRGTEYRQIHRMEAKSPPEPSGLARGAGERNSDFIRESDYIR